MIERAPQGPIIENSDFAIPFNNVAGVSKVRFPRVGLLVDLVRALSASDRAIVINQTAISVGP